MSLIRRSISAKFAVATGIGAVLVIAATLFGFGKAWSGIDTIRRDVLGHNYDNAFQVLTIQSDFKKQVQEWKDVLLRGSDPESLKKYWGNFEADEKKLHDGVVSLLPNLSDQEGKELAEQFLTAHQRMGEDYRRGLQRYKDAGFVASAGDAAVKGMDRAPTELLTKCAARLQKVALQSSSGAIDRSYSGILWSLALVGGACVLAGILVLVFVKTHMLTPIARLKRDLQALAELDFSANVEQLSSDEVGTIAAHAEQVRLKLREVLSMVRDSAAHVSSVSGRVTASARNIAEGSMEISMQAGTVATAGEEMTATSYDIAKSCQMAAEGAQAASRSAEDGVGVVEKTIRVMKDIAEKVQDSAKTVDALGARSDEIGAIIGTIEDIADQTNLLALNAAIEAARAGEQGRGFAVVADEVRALAERTSKATREIGTMIVAIQTETKSAVTVMEQGVQQVEAGTAEASRSGAALRQILELINTVSTQVSQIATAAEEQTATTSEISKNLQQINAVVGDASHGASDSATAAAELSANASELQHLVDRFRL